MKDKFTADKIEDQRFNQVLFTGVSSLQIDPEQKKQDGEELEELSKFVREDMVGKIVSEWANSVRKAPVDSASIATFLHQYGLNVRYLGEITQRFEKA